MNETPATSTSTCTEPSGMERIFCLFVLAMEMTETGLFITAKHACVGYAQSFLGSSCMRL